MNKEERTGSHPTKASSADVSTSSQQPGAADKRTTAIESTRDEARKTADEIRHQGSEVLETAKDEARELADQQKRTGAEKMSGLAHAMETAADDLEQSSPTMAKYTRIVASSVDSASDRLREQSLGEIMSSVNDFARREPVAFFGTALFAGFAMTRFLKSSQENSYQHAGQTGATATGSQAGRSSHSTSASSARSTSARRTIP